jgi:hypothetical protein
MPGARIRRESPNARLFWSCIALPAAESRIERLAPAAVRLISERLLGWKPDDMALAISRRIDSSMRVRCDVYSGAVTPLATVGRPHAQPRRASVPRSGSRPRSGAAIPLYAARGAHLWLIEPVGARLEAYELVNAHWSWLGTWTDEREARIPPFDAVPLDLIAVWEWTGLRG